MDKNASFWRIFEIWFDTSMAGKSTDKP